MFIFIIPPSKYSENATNDAFDPISFIIVDWQNFQFSIKWTLIEYLIAFIARCTKA